MSGGAWARLWKVLASCCADNTGSIMPMMAMGLIVTLAAAAIAVDLTRIYSLKEKLGTTADAVALAAATRLPDKSGAKTAALEYSRKNMPVALYGEVLTPGDIELGHWDAANHVLMADGVAPSAVRVTLRLADANGNATTTLFARIFGIRTFDVAESAAAGRRSPACVVSLNPAANHSMTLDSNAHVDAEDCTVQVNSTKPNALKVLKKSTVLATAICVAGGTQIHPSASAMPKPTTGCPPTPDPLAEVQPPDYGGCTYKNARYVDAHGTINPGVYCGGLEIDGKSILTLAAGLYVIANGKLAVLRNSIVRGEGVVFYLTGSESLIQFDSSSSLSLTAPSSGELAGILFFQDRNYVGTHQWNSSSPIDLTGTIYLPSGNFVSKSSNAITPLNSCNVLIANTIGFEANSGMSIDLGGARCRNALPRALRGAVMLLE